MPPTKRWQVLGVLLLGISALDAQPLRSVKLPPQAREVCEIVRFKDKWGPLEPSYRYGPKKFDALHDVYEFRAGASGAQILVRGFSPSAKVLSRYVYLIDLGYAPAVVRRASLEEWDKATKLASPDGAGAPYVMIPWPHLPDLSKSLNPLLSKSGKFWVRHGALFSVPSRSYVVLQSWTGTIYVGRGPLQGGEGRNRGQVFLDFYNSQSGKSYFTIEAEYREHPDFALRTSGWINDRVFTVPLGKELEQMLVCDFGTAR